MANIFKKAAKFIKTAANVAAKSGVLGFLPGGNIVSKGISLITAATANKAAKTSSEIVKPQPSTVVKNASLNVQQNKQTYMENQQQTSQTNDFVAKAKEFLKKYWVYIAAAGVGVFLLLPMLKKKRR